MRSFIDDPRIGFTLTTTDSFPPKGKAMLRLLLLSIVTLVAFLSTPGAANAQVPTMGFFVSGEFRINDPAGPDADPNSADDDLWDGDDVGPAPILMPQLAPVASVLRREGGSHFIAAWNDRSWRLSGQAVSTDFTVGIGLTDLGLSSPWTHDLARSIDGSAAPGHLPPPPPYEPGGANIDLGWLDVQEFPTSAVGGNGYAYVALSNIDTTVGPVAESIVLARTLDGTTWELTTVIANVSGDFADLQPHVSAGRSSAAKEHVYLTWVRFTEAQQQLPRSFSIWFAESRDGGQTFSNPIPISGVLPALAQSTPAPTASSAVGPQGDVHVIWYHPAGTLDDSPPGLRYADGDCYPPSIPPDTFEFRRFEPDLNGQPGDGTWFPDIGDFPRVNAVRS